MIDYDVLNGSKYINRSGFLYELEQLIKNHKKFTINYSTADEYVNNKLSDLLIKYNVKGYFIEGNDEDEINNILEIADILGWTAGSYLGAVGLPVIAGKGAIALAENYGVEALVDIIWKVTEEGAQVLDPVTGFFIRGIGLIAGGLIGKKISNVATKKYIVRTSISTEKPPQGFMCDLIFEPTR